MTAIALAAGEALRTYRYKPSAPRRRSNPDHTALLLSGGGNMTFFHLGVVKVLRTGGLLPRVFSGASAGAVIGGLLATRTDRELDLLHEDEFAFINFADRQPHDQYTAEMLAEQLASVLPDVTFAEAEEISGRALNISLAAIGDGGVICGPRTTPHVLVRDAVRASCAVPFVFEPVVVHERRHGRVQPFRSGQGWVDGSLYADVPAKFIKRHYQVRHTIVSLVNPAVRPFVPDHGQSRGPTALMRGMAMRAAHKAALGVAQIGRFSASSRARNMFEAARRVMQQRYHGDLVLTPSRRLVWSDLLDHPSRELVTRLMADGEARTRARLDEVRALALRDLPSRQVAYQPQPAYAFA